MVISDEQRERLEKLAASSDEEIDTEDIPEVLDWSGAVRGGLDRWRAGAVPVPVDADVVTWFRTHAADDRSYEHEMNRVLRQHMARQSKPQRA